MPFATAALAQPQLLSRLLAEAALRRPHAREGAGLALTACVTGSAAGHKEEDVQSKIHHSWCKSQACQYVRRRSQVPMKVQ